MKLNIEKLRKNAQQFNLNWYNISKIKGLPEEFIRDFQDKFSIAAWRNICENQNLSEKFIRDFQGKFDEATWYYIGTYQDLSEKFIRDFQDKLDIFNLCYIGKHQILPEDLIEKYSVKTYSIGVEHHCGLSNRSIYILNNQPDIINIGCFSGTEQEAIEAVKERYKDNPEICQDYIQKIKSCFEQAKNRI